MYTWVYPSVEAAYFAVFEGVEPDSIKDIRRIDLDPDDYIEAEWIGFELDNSHGVNRFFDLSRMVIVRRVKSGMERKSLVSGWTSPRLIPFNRDVENQYISIRRVDDGPESQFDIESLFEEADNRLGNK